MDHDGVSLLAARMAGAIDAASLGSGPWNEVPKLFAQAFPGSFSSLHSIGLTDGRVGFLTAHNIDPDFLRTFVEHYTFINPWNESHWTRVPSGTVNLSEEVSPARLFSRSEFYNDWLAPQDVDAAAAVKIDGGNGQSALFMIHYPLALADNYNAAVAEVLRRVRGNLQRTVEIAGRLRSSAEGAAASAALVERGRGAAFVIDGERRLRDANTEAARLFTAGRAVVVRSGRCHLAAKEADERFGAMLSALVRGVPADGARLSFRDAEGAWQVAMAALPAPPDAGLASLFSPRRMVLVLVTDLGAASRASGDFSALAATFHLTPAEIAFCNRLFQGDSVSEAADRLGIALETARTRLKSIQQKTGTSRQGQLMLLLSRLS
ncbi:helix-turn-helix transcriptional regulator [Kumtagia ephedrae]|uniref:HTH luxR-type domain-containing protein n=1 Tax=Kumtagia ephedrae TaxID=2116701 RepID=A0A2P7S5C8_9HYPH|nr:helix-turn-helix transcriptional regulator [Mesorhizobium ephedrae]PSJ57686.1 hypothetical protein C7I84_16765 [Mesorhizobium ephedrae]